MSEKDPTRIYSVKIEDITIDENFNVRLDSDDLQEHVKALAISITQVGIKQPLTAYRVEGSGGAEDEATILTDGHCRFAAVLLANEEMGAEIKSVPVRFESKFTNEVDRTEGLMIRAGGRALSLLEQAEVVRRLIAFGRSEEAIAEHTGCSLSHVKNLVLLGSASEAIRQMILRGSVSASNAIEAIRKFGAKAEEALAEAMTMVEGQGKKRVTQKQLKKKSKIDWKVYGPKCRDMIETLAFSLDTEEVRAANKADAETLLIEISELEKS